MGTDRMGTDAFSLSLAAPAALKASALRPLGRKDPGTGAWPCCRSSGVTLRRAVLKVGGGERQRLLNVVRIKPGIVPVKVLPVRIERHGLHHSTHRQPHATDARLAVHLVRVPRYAVEGRHLFYSDSLRVVWG